MPTTLADDPAAFAALVLRIAAHVADLPEAQRDAGLTIALGDLGTAVGADRAYSFLLDEQSGTLRNDHEWCAPGITPQRETLQAVPVEIVGGWWPRFDAGAPVVIPSVAALDPTTHPEAEILAAQAIRSLLAVPMRRHGRTFGFVGFDAVRAERAWSEPEVRALQVAAHLIGGTLERAATATERDEAARRLAQLADQLPGALFQFELLPDGARRFTYTSPRFGELLGIDTRALADDGRPALNRVHGDDRAAFEDALRRSARRLERWDHEFRATDAQGRLLVIHGRAEPSRRADGAVVFHGVLHDVSERLAQQQALERGAAFRRSLLTLTHDLLARDVTDDLYSSVLSLATYHVPGADAGSVIVRGADDRFHFEAAVGFDLDALRSISFEAGDMPRKQPPQVEVLAGGGEHDLLSAPIRAVLESAGRLREIQATLSVPVLVHGDTVAYMQLDSFERPDAFDDDAIASGTLLAGLLGALLQRLSLESKLRLERSKLDHMAHHDHLTGLPNRVLLSDRLEQALARDHRADRGTALLVVDLDGFKTVNDTFGHAAGDQLLTAISDRLREVLRGEDTIARLGGDEFAVVASGLHDATSAGTVARKVADVVSASFAVAGREVRVGGSIGVAIAPQDGADAGTLLKNADLAMYRVKNEGRGAIAFFTADLDTRLRARATLTEDLRAALHDGGLHLVFQPRVRLYDGHPIGAEALARWDHPRRGLVPPDEFVPLAEEAGLAHQLGAHVLDLACEAIADWRREGRAADWRVAVNVSPHQLRAGGFDEVVRDALARHRLPASALELEVTESAMLDERPQVQAPLQRLRQTGIRVAIDDFGTGYSSLHRLAVLPVDTLKIDRSFIAGLGRLGRDAAVVDAVLALAHGLGLEVVAEGVETDGQRHALLKRGCLLAQGFLFTGPLPAEHLWRWCGRQADESPLTPSGRARRAARRPTG